MRWSQRLTNVRLTIRRRLGKIFLQRQWLIQRQSIAMMSRLFGMMCPWMRRLCQLLSL